MEMYEKMYVVILTSNILSDKTYKCLGGYSCS